MTSRALRPCRSSPMPAGWCSWPPSFSAADAAGIEDGICRAAARRQKQRSAGRRRRRDLSSPGQEPPGGAGTGRRPLRDQLGLHQLSGGDAALRLYREETRRRRALHRTRQAGPRPRSDLLDTHGRVGAGHLCCAPLRRSEHHRGGQRGHRPEWRREQPQRGSQGTKGIRRIAGGDP